MSEGGEQENQRS